MTDLPRHPVAADRAPLAALWHAGWHDAHASVVHQRLVDLRTLKSFDDRLEPRWPYLRAIGPAGAPLGFSVIADDELEQFYVAPAGRGTGIAARLLADAEARLAAAGVRDAWLACAIGNDRAARFYAKSGWTHAGECTIALDVADEHADLVVWRMEKRLAEATGARA